MAEPLFLGIDLGISTVKAALCTVQGRLVQIESQEYMIMPEGDKIEADPQVYWRPTANVIRQVLRTWGGDPEQIVAVAVSSHGETIFPMQANGNSVRKALNWMDTRSQTEANELLSLFGNQKVLELSGQPEINSIWPITKFRWMSKHEPGELAQTDYFLLPDDYLLYRLSGQFVGEYTLWGSSLVLDIRTKKISDEMLAFAGISPKQIPALVPAGTEIGTISSACAQETGLSPKTKVVTGGHDQVCAAIAAGNIAPGIVTESTGSVLALLASVDEPIFDLASKVPCHVHAVPDMYCMLPWNPTGGLSLKWFKDRFALDLIQQAQAENIDVYDLMTSLAEQAPPGCDGLVMLPHLEGALFPEYDAQARAVFFGFTLKHTRSHFIRSVLESVGYMIRRDLEGLEGLGVGAKELRVLGGGAKSKLWSQIKADVCDKTVVMPALREAAVVGAAMLAAVGSGFYPDLRSAVQAMATSGDLCMPNQERHETYDAGYEIYKALFETVQPLFPRLRPVESRENTG